MSSEHDATLRRFEERLATSGDGDYVLRLFVNGASDLSVQAIGNVRALCDTHLNGRYRLEVVDVHRNVELMTQHRVLAAPTLVKELPLPQRRLVGDLSDPTRFLVGLDIRASDPPVNGD